MQIMALTYLETVCKGKFNTRGCRKPINSVFNWLSYRKEYESQLTIDLEGINHIASLNNTE